MPNIPLPEIAALRLAGACWEERAAASGAEEAHRLLEQMDAVLEFIPFVPEPLRGMMADQAWSILCLAIQRFPSPDDGFVTLLSRSLDYGS